MTQFNPENLTDDQIITLLQMLFTNMNNLDKVYYDLFINTVPMDINLERYDEFGTLQTYTIPNRAKDKTQVYLGQGSPEGVQEAKVGSFYFDVTNREIYFKSNQTERYGWVALYTQYNFQEGRDYLAPTGDASSLQNLNMNNASLGVLDVKRGGTGSEGFNGLVKCVATTVGDVTTYQYREAIAGLDYASADVLTAMAGMVAFFAGATAPTGWLICNGQAVSRTTYARLFSYIGTIYGTGDGSTTFNLPDLRGVFTRGLDLGKGYDTGRTLGSYQEDTVKNHSHQTGAQWLVDDGNAAGGGNNSTYGINSYYNDSETRPKNIALLPCIKY